MDIRSTRYATLVVIAAIAVSCATVGVNHVKRGAYLLEQRRPDEAIEACNAALRANQRSSDAYIIRARAYLQKSDYAAAISDCASALRLDRTLAAAHIVRASAHMASDDFGRAEADVQEAIELEPWLAEPHLVRAHLRFAQGDFAEALSACEVALGINPSLDGAAEFRMKILGSAKDGPADLAAENSPYPDILAERTDAELTVPDEEPTDGSVPVPIEAVPGTRDTIAVLDLVANDTSPGLVRAVSDLLSTALWKSGRFHMLERQHIAQVTEALSDTRDGVWVCDEVSCAVDIGRNLNTTEVIIGSVSRFGRRIAINVRVVNVDSAEIIAAEAVQAESEESIPEAVEELADLITEALVDRQE